MIHVNVYLDIIIHIGIHTHANICIMCYVHSTHIYYVCDEQLANLSRYLKAATSLRLIELATCGKHKKGKQFMMQESLEQPRGGQDFCLLNHCCRTRASRLCNTFSKHSLKRTQWTTEFHSVSLKRRQRQSQQHRCERRTALGSYNSPACGQDVFW
jgi:hypothetical protein